MTSDSDLEAEVRFLRGWSQMGSLPGKGYALWRGVVGVCPACPDGGERERGAVAPQNPGYLPWVTRYSMSMLFPHDQGR
jgi:hypothetical protein